MDSKTPAPRISESSLLRLPNEIRNRIYHFVTQHNQADTHIFPKNPTVLSTKLFTWRDGADIRFPKRRKFLALGLLQTNHQLNCEVTGPFYSACRFFFQSFNTAVTFIRRLRPETEQYLHRIIVRGTFWSSMRTDECWMLGAYGRILRPCGSLSKGPVREDLDVDQRLRHSKLRLHWCMIVAFDNDHGIGPSNYGGETSMFEMLAEARWYYPPQFRIYLISYLAAGETYVGHLRCLQKFLLAQGNDCTITIIRNIKEEL